MYVGPYVVVIGSLCCFHHYCDRSRAICPGFDLLVKSFCLFCLLLNCTKITISEPKPEDASLINDLIKASWYATYISPEYGITKEVIDSTFNCDVDRRQIDSLRIRALIKGVNDVSLVAKEGSAILGFARLEIKNKAVEWISMYVHPNHVGKGIGTALWKSVSKRLPPDLPIIVEVATYTKAVQFYKTIGFIDTGDRTSACITEDCKVVIPLMRLIYNSRLKT